MLSRVFLIKQGKCCGNECLMCPYEQKHRGLSSTICKKILKNLDPWEKKEVLEYLPNQTK